MTDNEKQVVYKQITEGMRTVEELTGKELHDLKEHWFVDMKSMPPFEFYLLLDNERRRREVASASKPMKPIDKDFF